ncbi:MAG: hypothetical protein JWP87_5678, partial [Labilithrix sp.]|nr:hypothetical protein [Labilithrix sp.]
LESTPSAKDGGTRPTDAGAASDAGTTSAPDAGAATYTARCNGYLQSEREHEANDTIAGANMLDYFTCAGINSANDVDYYVFDSDSFVQLTFDPDDDAAISIKSPSGVISSAQGGATYRSGERGRYFVAIDSPGHKLQTYFIVR